MTCFFRTVDGVEHPFELEVLRLRPGDRLVLRVPHQVTAEHAVHIRDALRDALPDGVKAIVLEPGITLEKVPAGW
jgi:hypothetical protein